jgi:hypothetical protein
MYFCSCAVEVHPQGCRAAFFWGKKGMATSFSSCVVEMRWDCHASLAWVAEKEMTFGSCAAARRSGYHALFSLAVMEMAMILYFCEEENQRCCSSFEAGRHPDCRASFS